MLLSNLILILLFVILPLLWIKHVLNKSMKLYIRVQQLKSNLEGNLAQKNDVMKCVIAALPSDAGLQQDGKKNSCCSQDMQADMLSKEYREQDAVFEKVISFMERNPGCVQQDRFMELARQMNDAGKRCLAAVKSYNAGAAKYNKYISSFPRSVVAKMKHMEVVPAVSFVEQHYDGEVS